MILAAAWLVVVVGAVLLVCGVVVLVQDVRLKSRRPAAPALPEPIEPDPPVERCSCPIPGEPIEVDHTAPLTGEVSIVRVVCSTCWNETKPTARNPSRPSDYTWTCPHCGTADTGPQAAVFQWADRHLATHRTEAIQSSDRLRGLTNYPPSPSPEVYVAQSCPHDVQDVETITIGGGSVSLFRVCTACGSRLPL